MTTIGTISLIATINTSQYTKGVETINKANDSFEKSTNDTEKKTDKSWAKMGVAIGAVAAIAQTVLTKAFSAVSSSVSDAVKRVDTLNAFPMVMKNVGIGTDDARKAIEKLTKGITGLPTALDSAAASVQTLTMKTGDVDKATDIFLALNNALLAGGASMDRQGQAAVQFAQGFARGKPDLVEWRALMETMPAQMQQLAKSFGKVDALSLYEDIRDGNVTMEDFSKKLVQLNSKGVGGLPSFTEQAKNATGGIQTGFANMNTAIVRGIGAVIQAIGSENISNAIAAIGKVLEFTLKILATVITWLVTNIPKAVKAVVEFGKGTVDNIVNAWKGVVSFFTTVWNGITDVVRTAVDTIVDIYNTVKDALVTAFQAGVQWAVDLYKTVSGALVSAFQAFVAWLEKNRTLLTNIGIVIGTILLPKLMAIGIEALKSAYSAVTSFVMISASAIKEAAIASAAWVKSSITTTKSFISTAASAVVESAKASFAWTVNAAKASFAWVTKTLPAMIGVFATMAAQATQKAIITGGVWAMQAAQVAMRWGITMGLYLQQLAVVVIQTVAAGARMAAAWLMALGPIGLIIAAVAGAAALIIANWDAVSGFVSGVFTNIGNFARDTWNNITEIFGNVGKWFTDKFDGAVSGIKKAFGGIGAWFKSVWDGIISIFGKVGTAIGDAIGGAFKNVINSVLRFVVNLINGFIDGINGVISIINKIPGVDIGKLGKLPIPQLAEGGIVSSATLAVIGEGSEPEAVIPLSKLDKMLANGGDGSGGDTFNITVNASADMIRSENDKREFANMIIDSFNQQRKAKGMATI